MFIIMLVFPTIRYLILFCDIAIWGFKVLAIVCSVSLFSFPISQVTFIIVCFPNIRGWLYSQFMLQIKLFFSIFLLKYCFQFFLSNWGYKKNYYYETYMCIIFIYSLYLHLFFISMLIFLLNMLNKKSQIFFCKILSIPSFFPPHTYFLLWNYKYH